MAQVINIRRPETTRAIREVAACWDVTLTDTVRIVVAARLEVLRREREGLPPLTDEEHDFFVDEQKRTARRAIRRRPNAT